MSKPTPFEFLHRQLGAEFKDYSGWLLPKTYGNLEAETAGLISSCGAFDMSGFGRIVLKGENAKVLLDLLLASSTQGLAAGKWIWGVCVGSNGSFPGMVRVAQLNNSFMLFTSPAKKDVVLDLLSRCASDHAVKGVSVEDQTDKTGMISVYGPKAVETLNKIIPLDLASIEEGGIKSFSFFMMNITVIRGGWLNEDGLEIICPAGAARFAGGAIERYHQQESITLAGMDCLESAMKKAGIQIALGDDVQMSLDERMSAMIDMSKDFVGKDSLKA